MIHLSQTAPWNSRLTNPYRTRFTEHGGRYFRAESYNLSGFWFVWEIDRDGETLGDPKTAIVAMALNLPQVRLAVELRVEGKDTDAIRNALIALGPQGTGRNSPENVERRRNWGR